MIDKSTLMRWRQEFLEELERILGPRDEGFALGDIVRHPLGTNAPEIYCRPDRRTVDVRIGTYAMSGAYDGHLAKWQLAHECVHLIDPNFCPPTNVMEEGMATWFQNRKVEEPFVTVFTQFGGSAYDAAERLVAPLMNDGYLPERLRLLRQNGARIGRVTSDELMGDATRIEHPAAMALTARFGS